jgi:CarD family transcriptional regulator
MEASFTVGDKAYYPVHGVAEIVALESLELGGTEVNLYILKVLESGLTIKVPTNNAAAVGLREIMSLEEVGEIYAIFQSEDRASDNQTWNRRHREYMEKIKTGSAFEIAEVLRDLCLLRLTKDLSFGERKILDTAKGLLVKEIALAKDLTETEIEDEIYAIFDKRAAA